MIHHLAQIDDSAVIDDSATIMNHAFIGPNVTIGPGCIIHPYAVISQDTTLGANNVVYSHAVLGGDPQDITQGDERTQLVVGDNNIFREQVTVSRGSHKQDKLTHIGNNNFLMAYVHIGHDCLVGDHNVFTNYTGLSGHVTVDHNVVFSGYVGVHQFVNVGAYAFIGRGCMVTQDILPYLMVTGQDAKVSGLNRVGLKRQGFDEARMRYLKGAFRVLFRQSHTLVQAADVLREQLPECPDYQLLLDGIARAKRGVAR